MSSKNRKSVENVTEQAATETAPVETATETAPVETATETAPVETATETTPVETEQEKVEEAAKTLVEASVEQTGAAEVVAAAKTLHRFICSTQEERKILFAAYAAVCKLAMITKADFKDTGSWSVEIELTDDQYQAIDVCYAAHRVAFKAAVKTALDNETAAIKAAFAAPAEAAPAEAAPAQ